MSRSASISYGFGFPIDDVSEKGLIEFIKAHEKTFCQTDDEVEIFEELSTITDVSDKEISAKVNALFEDYQSDLNCNYGYGAAISNIITREIDINMSYESGNVGDAPCVMLCETMPWIYTEKERSLTGESLTDLLIPYVIELGLKEDIIGYYQVEYYG